MSDFKWTKKDLLSIYDLSAEEIIHILDTAEEFKKVSQRRVKKVPALRGKTVVNFFVEPSTRTRISFELAEQRLSADIINIATESSSLKKAAELSMPAMVHTAIRHRRCLTSLPFVKRKVLSKV